jgi:arylsulfatase A-like enzyme
VLSLALLGIAVLPLVASLTLPGSASAQETTRPNVLIIITDDQRAHRDAFQMMPETLRLFEVGGTRYSRAFTTTPTCCPSRSSIFSGRYAHNHGVLTNQQGSVLSTAQTVQAELQAAGYQTGLVGKYLNEVDGAPPHFDRYAKMSGLAGKTGYPGYYDVPFLLTGSAEEEIVTEYSTTFIGSRAVDLLDAFEESDDQPWFLFVAPLAPHRPFEPEERYADAPVPAFRANPAFLETNLNDKPSYVSGDRWQRPDGWAKQVRADQLRMLMSVDDQVERIFDRIDDLGEQDTLAFFLSDNGHLWGEHGITNKLVPYHPSIRIPLFLRWPGHVVEGATSGAIVANIDVAPTIYDAVGIAPSYTVDGRSLLDPLARTRLLVENWQSAPVYAASVRPGSVYIEYASGLREYYDMAADPWQLTNVFGDRSVGNEPRRPRRLATILERDAACVGTSCP